MNSKINRTSLKKLSLLILLCAFSVLAVQGGSWTNYFNGSGNGNDFATAIAVDGGGYVYVTGYVTTVSNGYDYCTIKYSNGGTPVWTNFYRGASNYSDTARAITLDAAGNVYVSGSSGVNSGPASCLTIKYLGDGMALWTNVYVGLTNSTNSGSAIAADVLGDLYVMCSSVDYRFTTWKDITIIKYSSSGVLQWTNFFDAGTISGVASVDSPKGMALDGTNSVYVTGYSGDPSSSRYTFTTLKYSNTGSTLLTNHSSSYPPSYGYDDEATGLAVDTNHNVYVTGYSKSGNDYDIATIKYSVAGIGLWTNRYNGPAKTNDGSGGLALDNAGNIYVAGSAGITSNSSAFVTIKYNSAGTGLWTNYCSIPGYTNHYADRVLVDGGGNIIVSGRLQTGLNSCDYLTVTYSSSGTAIKTNRYIASATLNDVSNEKIAADQAGNLFLIGHTFNSGSGNADYVVIKYAAPLSPIPLNISQSGNNVILTWTNVSFSLQSAPTPSAAAFTNIPGAASPYTNPITGSQSFFRLMGN